MSKYSYVLLTVLTLVSVNGALADETTTKSTRTDAPGYSSTSSTTTQEQPVTQTTEQTRTESSPYGQEVTTKKSYKKAPCAKTTRTDTETTTTR
jgi:hypothetical protein